MYQKSALSYRKNPTYDKKSETYTQDPTAGPQTYWAPRAQVPQQFAALHWNPLPVKISLTPNSMVTHTVVKSPSPILSLCSAEEFQEMIDKMCERVFAKLGWNNYDEKN